ncbi:fibrocystin [Limosa lapponica baueri]|uniref:Fibrocystin n=1 Tax=Limosa lapponica baueri TaxID=1758121 RepID=A0A2I0TJW6_LIMLA|nr:fibrocystin [Limosa lapponica baueri]
MILVVILSSAASAFILTLALCWFKKSKSNNMEGTGAMGHATGQLEALNLQPCETKSVRKMSTVQCKTGDRDTFSSARKSDSHQQVRRVTSPGDSLELQQPTVPGCSRQKDAPKPSAGYKKEREKIERMPKPQNDLGEHVAVVAAEV